MKIQSTKLTTGCIQSHEDTKILCIQINNSLWLLIPESAFLPSNAADFIFHSYPTTSALIKYLKSGKNNRFQLKIDPSQTWGWLQNLIYGIIVKFAYKNSKNHFAENLK